MRYEMKIVNRAAAAMKKFRAAEPRVDEVRSLAHERYFFLILAQTPSGRARYFFSVAFSLSFFL